MKTWEIGENYVVNYLKNLGLSVINMNNKSKRSVFDLLIEGILRAEVKTAVNVKKKWYFALTHKQSIGISSKNKNYVILKSGRYRKDFRKTCDLIILCGIVGSKVHLFIIPPKVIPINQSTISMSINGGKWWKWHNRVDVIFNALKKVAS